MLKPVELEKTLAKVRGSEKVQQVRKVQHETGQKPFDQQLAQQKEKGISQDDEVVIGDEKHQGAKKEQTSSEPEKEMPVQKDSKIESTRLGTRIDVVG